MDSLLRWEVSFLSAQSHTLLSSPRSSLMYHSQCEPLGYDLNKSHEKKKSSVCFPWSLFFPLPLLPFPFIPSPHPTPLVKKHILLSVPTVKYSSWRNTKKVYAGRDMEYGKRKVGLLVLTAFGFHLSEAEML